MATRTSFFLHFHITPACMQAGIRTSGPESTASSEIVPDVLDNLAAKLRQDSEVLKMLDLVASGQIDKVVIGVGRETQA